MPFLIKYVIISLRKCFSKNKNAIEQLSQIIHWTTLEMTTEDIFKIGPYAGGRQKKVRAVAAYARYICAHVYIRW